jgi:hypothetical protein
MNPPTDALRRAMPKDAATKEADGKVLERGQLRMDEERHTCTWKNDPVSLTVTEFLLLKALASRPNVVKGRKCLDECRLRRSSVSRQANYPTATQAAAQETPGKRCRLRYHRDALWCGLSL